MLSLVMALDQQTEQSPAVPVALDQVRAPQYGRYLEEFTPGRVFRHPRGVTINRGLARAFAATFMETNPLYLNEDYARTHGFSDILVSPQLVFNLVLSLGVQNDSEKAMANLGYYHARFLDPVYPNDTLRSLTRVVDCRDRGEGKPGIVHFQTLGINQDHRVVLQYERKIMVHARGAHHASAFEDSEEIDFPWQEQPGLSLPIHKGPYLSELTGSSSYLEDFQVGDIIVHPNGRTVTDEHMGWSYGVGNTHPLHNDRIYSASLSGAMSGEPIVYGGLVFAWLVGLASRDVSENALWELGFTEGYHTQPTVAGDTLTAISRVLSIEPGPRSWPLGVVTFQLIGIKNQSAAHALKDYGADLFVKETTKKEKIKAKVFEVERRLLMKQRP